MQQSRRQFVRTLFIATQAAAVGSFLTPGSLFAADASADALNFLLIGDWGRKGEKDQMDVATQMGVTGDKLKPRFIVSVGDNFYEDGVASVTDDHWEKSFEKVYTAPSLQVPWWVVLGNHDYHGDCDAQIAYSQHSQRWNMPARYFTRTETIAPGQKVDFFYLDTTPMSKLDDDEVDFVHKPKTQDVPKQMAWFEAALAASTAPWKIVIAHHPVYTGGQHGDTPYVVKHVLPLMEKYGVQAYFNGHDHDLQHLQSEKVNFFCTGGGSKPRAAIKTTKRTKFGLGCSGFIAASLTTDKLHVEMIDSQGKMLYATDIARS